MQASEVGHIFAELLADGMSHEAIAREAGLAVSTVRRAISAARRDPKARLPHHLPRRWAIEHADEKPCDHATIPIPRGDAVYCARCYRCGYDGHWKLQIRKPVKAGKTYGTLAARRWARRQAHAQARV